MPEQAGSEISDSDTVPSLYSQIEDVFFLGGGFRTREKMFELRGQGGLSYSIDTAQPKNSATIFAEEQNARRSS